MRTVTCDNCQQQVASYQGRHEGRDLDTVVLEGVSGRAGILLPASMQRRDFCSTQCFWQWSRANDPEKPS